jgi:hypothetical protein
MNGIDPWLQIVKWLRGHPPEAARAIRRGAYVVREFGREFGQEFGQGRQPCAMANRLSISRIEWQTDSTILVSWSDPTLGRYQDQTWRAGFARTAGVCGLTGMPVRRGDAVYKPLIRAGARPLNAFDMILADTLKQKSKGLPIN